MRTASNNLSNIKEQAAKHKSLEHSGPVATLMGAAYFGIFFGLFAFAVNKQAAADIEAEKNRPAQAATKAEDQRRDCHDKRCHRGLFERTYSNYNSNYYSRHGAYGTQRGARR